jgi:hypothetical protein
MKRILAAWFALTADERKLLCIILALALLGLAAKYIFLHDSSGAAATPANPPRILPVGHGSR